MNKPRIFVLHLRQIVKLGALAIVGFLLIVTMIFFFARGDSNQTASTYTYEQIAFEPGTYRSRVYLSYKPAYLAVTVTEDEIVSISLEPLTANQELLYPLLTPTVEKLAWEIVETQKLDVSSTIDNSATSHVIVSAVERALEEATLQ